MIFAGAFLIPYFLCLCIAGLPLLIMELGLGQYMSQGGITAWNIIPGAKGIFACTTIKSTVESGVAAPGVVTSEHKQFLLFFLPIFSL